MSSRRVGILLEMLLEARVCGGIDLPTISDACRQAQALRNFQCLVSLPRKHQDLSCYWGNDPNRASAKTQSGTWEVDQCTGVIALNCLAMHPPAVSKVPDHTMLLYVL
eukprot:12524177-Ditylum_brightwellii.AAC.1